MSVKRAVELLFLIGLFFFPFNEYEGIPFLGEFTSEVAVLFFIPAFLLILMYSLETKKIYFPYKNKLYFIVILFLVWCVVSILLNFHNISTYYFKQTSGINRFIRQFIALLLSSVVFFQVYWFVLKDKTILEILLLIRKVFFCSFIVVSIYGFLEIITVYFGVSLLTPVLESLSYLPFIEVRQHVGGRISSVSYEPPFLAIYLITIAGWMFSYIITSKSIKKYIPSIVVLLLTFFSGSRTALIVVTIQFLIFIYYLYYFYGYKKIVIYSLKYSLLLILTIGLFTGVKFYEAIEEKVESLDFIGNLKNNPSNKSRLGIQYASLVVFTKNPISGVGFGQQGFESREEYPTWAIKNNYEFEVFYKNKKEKSFPPGYNVYTRILAELGLIGLLIFFYLQYSMLKQALKLTRYKKKEVRLLGVILFITLIGLFVNWMQIDSFRIYGVWLSLAILIIISTTKDEQNNYINTSL